MKTYAVTLGKDMDVEGIPMKAGEHVAAITSEVSPHTVLGLLQFSHAIAEEITDAADDDDSEAEPMAETIAVDDASDDDVIRTEPIKPVDPQPEQKQEPADSTEDAGDQIAEFLADGLDEKTAEALARAGLASPEAVRDYLKSGNLLTDLDDIGPRRAERIESIYRH